jgi:hypothetical protein
MTTILIWLGSGFAFSVGLITGFIIMGLSYRKRPDLDDSRKATEALLERNEIGRQQVKALEAIARSQLR